MGHIFSKFGSSLRKCYGASLLCSLLSFALVSINPFCPCEQVLDVGIQDQLRSHLLELKPRPSIYSPDFIAANQADRADNVLHGNKWDMVQRIQRDMKDFKKAKKLDKVCGNDRTGIRENGY